MATKAEIDRKTDKPIGDSTYRDLPAIGQPDNGTLGPLIQNLGIEAAVVRSNWIGDDAETIDRALCLYLYGREDGRRGDSRLAWNFVQGNINTYTFLASRVPPTITFRSASVNEEGVWVLIKPFSIPPATDPQTGGPMIDPQTGQPHQAIPLNLYEPIDEAAVPAVPPTHRVCINTETCVDVAQKIFDIKRRDCRMDQVIRDAVFAKQLGGWVMGYMQWNKWKEEPYFKIEPLYQWLTDELKSDVKDMNFIRLDVPTDVNEAKAAWPQIADEIDAAASRGIYYETGSAGYSGIYTSTAYQRPVVTMVYCWMRNQEAPMSLDEALGVGLVKVNENPAPEGSPEGTVNSPKIMHAHMDSDLTDSFGEDGDRNHEKLHDDHPHKLVVRQTVMFLLTTCYQEIPKEIFSLQI